MRLPRNYLDCLRKDKICLQNKGLADKQFVLKKLLNNSLQKIICNHNFYFHSYLLFFLSFLAKIALLKLRVIVLEFVANP